MGERRCYYVLVEAAGVTHRVGVTVYKLGADAELIATEVRRLLDGELPDRIVVDRIEEPDKIPSWMTIPEWIVARRRLAEWLPVGERPA